MSARRKKLLFYITITLFLAFLALSGMVILFPESAIDQNFLEFVEHRAARNPVLDRAMTVISWPGYRPASWIVVIIAASIFYLLQFKREAFFVLLTLLSGLVSASLKIIMNRPRPEYSFEEIIETSSQSFPSGHVLFYTVFFGFTTVLMIHLKEIPKILRLLVGAVCLIFILVVPFSRIYLGAHWFTDIIGGFMIGIVCLYILCTQYFINRTN